MDIKEVPELLARGDEQAMSFLYDHYASALYGIIYRVVGSPAKAEQILEQSFLSFWSNISAYNPENGSLFTWMCGIARKLSSECRSVRTNFNTEKTEHDIKMMEGLQQESKDVL